MNVATVQVNTYLEILRRDLGARYSPDTVRTYLRQAKDFLEYAGIKRGYTREEVLSYVDHLISTGQSAASINTILSSVRALFRALKHPWVLSKTDQHLGLPKSREGGPTLLLQEVAALIKGIPKGTGEQQTVVALSTTYGLRPIEITWTMASGCDGQTFILQTAKAGELRRHRIPNQVKPFLTFAPQHISRAKLHNIFNELMVLYVRRPRKGEGWHSVRRSLETELMSSDVSIQAVARWMGRTMKETDFRYYRPEQARLDLEIYGKHPFLSYWEG